MGMPIFSTGSAGATSPNPNPYRFQIKDYKIVGKLAVLKVNYPDCTTFGGDKVLVYEDGKAFRSAVMAKKLDPHFLEEECSPLARFPGNARGWDFAIYFAESLER